MACCRAADVDFRQWMVFFLNNVHRYDDNLNMDLAELLPHAFKNYNTKSEWIWECSEQVGVHYNFVGAFWKNAKNNHTIFKTNPDSSRRLQGRDFSFWSRRGLPKGYQNIQIWFRVFESLFSSSFEVTVQPRCFSGSSSSTFISKPHWTEWIMFIRYLKIECLIFNVSIFAYINK